MGSILQRIAPSWRRRWRLLAILAGASLAAILLAATAVNVAMYAWWQRDPPSDARSHGLNAYWAAHTWVGDPHSDDEYRAFAESIVAHEISDVFAHAGPLEADGSVPADKIAYAVPFTEAMRRYAPGVRVQAYLGQIEARDGGILDIRDEGTREGIVRTAGAMIALGFDGIHYDIEPIPSGDPAFLALLDATRAELDARGDGHVLSVALEQMQLPRGMRQAAWAMSRGGNDPSPGFLRDVARRADQIAIMTYDTGAPTAYLFGWFVAWQTEHVARTVGDDAAVFIGVPTYDRGSAGKFHARAENMASGIRGVRKGVARLSDDSRGNVGVAIFAEWTTTDDEWATYRRDWLGE